MMQETKPDWQHHGVTIIAMNGDYRCSVISKRKLWLPKNAVLRLFLSRFIHVPGSRHGFELLPLFMIRSTSAAEYAWLESRPFRLLRRWSSRQIAC